MTHIRRAILTILVIGALLTILNARQAQAAIDSDTARTTTITASAPINGGVCCIG